MAQLARDQVGGKLFVLLRESRWILFVACALYFTVVLFGYQHDDPAWSHSGTGAVTHNPGGILGAYLADLLFYLFGVSAWWWVGLMLQRVWAGYHSLRAGGLFDRRTVWVSGIGFVLLLLSSSALEAIRLHSLNVALPLVPGGMAGVVLGDVLTRLFGFTGATLLLLALLATSFSVFSGLSWLRFVDHLGAALETAYLWARRVWQTRQDKRIGVQAKTQRTAVVEEEKKRVEDHQPIHIEMAVVDVPKSERVTQEKQTQLFAEIPDSPLPPLHLLDSAVKQVESATPAQGLWRGGQSGGRLSRSGHHALRDRSRRRRKGQSDHQSGEGPGARAVGGEHPYGRNHTRQGLYGIGVAQLQAADGAVVRDIEFAGICRYGLHADHRHGQGHLRQAGGGRLGQDAACGGGGYHRFG
jgi:DNA segregation ATPase FtsK/SpoIIIE-like protein